MNGMSAAKIAAAEALGPMLDSFHLIGGQLLQRVWKSITEGDVSRLTFEFAGVSLVVTADPQDDTLDLSTTKNVVHDKASDIDASSLRPWVDLIGTPFGWGWVTINQQGYCDGVLLSFAGIVPQVMLNVVASSIKESLITPLTRRLPTCETERA